MSTTLIVAMALMWISGFILGLATGVIVGVITRQGALLKGERDAK